MSELENYMMDADDVAKLCRFPKDRLTKQFVS